MKENKFDFSVFMAVIMLIVLIGGLLVGTVFGIVNNNQVVHADYVFNQNLLPYTDLSFADATYTSSISGVPYSNNDIVLNGGTLSLSSSGITIAGITTYLYNQIKFYCDLVVGNTYTATVLIDSYTGGSTYSKAMLGVAGSAFLPSSSIQFNQTGLVSLTFVAAQGDNGIFVQGLNTQPAIIFTFSKIKLEVGDIFTGWEADPMYLEGYNAGYQAGYQGGYDVGYQSGYDTGFTDGYDSSAISRLYTKLGNLYYGSSLLSSNFTFDNVNYVMGDYTEDLRSLYSYNNPNFAVIDSLDGEPAGSQIGFEISNDFLYGDILIVLPYSTYNNDFQVVFENTSNGEILYTNKNDTLHWFLSSHLGNVNNSSVWSIDLYVIKFFSPEPVNVYFLPMNNESDYGSNPVYFNLSQSLGAVYSTQSQVALNDFDDGYQKGLKDGADSAVQANAQAVSNARAAGYEEGRREALEDSNDYSFMGLLGAVFDAPIKSFQGLLNFDVLGVNMQSFVLALLSLSVIIIIIKIALGGK